MKQTAVEFLMHHISEDQLVRAKSAIEWARVIKQAKAMEKEQIIDAWDNGCEDDGIIDNAEQYYNETFKSE